MHSSAAHYMSVLWSSLGDGVFDNSTLLQPHYTPGLIDLQQGFVSLIMTVNGLQQCAPVIDSDTITITFKPLPAITLSGTDTICEGTSVFVTMTLSGLGPWSVTYTDGLNNFTINNIPASPYNLSVSPIATTTYTILSVTDANCTVTQTGIRRCGPRQGHCRPCSFRGNDSPHRAVHLLRGRWE